MIIEVTLIAFIASFATFGPISRDWIANRCGGKEVPVLRRFGYPLTGRGVADPLLIAAMCDCNLISREVL